MTEKITYMHCQPDAEWDKYGWQMTMISTKEAPWAVPPMDTRTKARLRFQRKRRKERFGTCMLE